MRIATHLLYTAYTVAAICVVAPASTGQLPPDVRQDHWASSAVQQILRSGVMTLQDDHQFHGEAHVTHVQAVIALAALSKKLEAGAWQPGDASPVPDSVSKTITGTAWRTTPVTRYQLASTLVRFANYFAKGMPRPGPGAKDMGKSTILPAHVKVPVAAGTPAYAAYKYLTDGRMISPTSPLMKADNQNLKAIELSQGISEAAAGLSDKLTELGHDEHGDTPDKSFHTKKPN